MIKKSLHNRFSLIAIACLFAALAGCSNPKEQSSHRNLFAELLGKSQQEIDAKVEHDFQQLFYGDAETESVYFPVGEDMAYILDYASNDVRSEGMSYGMMVAVQLNKRDEFDRLWKWAYTNMRHSEGPLEGYFAWQCSIEGEKLDPGSASDGEEWFATALFFAANKWGNGEGIFNYTAHANNLLEAMIHKEPGPDRPIVSIFDPEYHMVRFVPWQDWDGVTDASYHLPAFYELWVKWADSNNDFWAKCATVSRERFKEEAHPQTGLMPDYSYYKPTERAIGDHKDFRFDAWRVISNVALDHHWWGKDAEWQTMQSNRILAFLAQHYPNIPNQFTVDGTPLSPDVSAGIFAMAATGGLAADPEVAKQFVEHFWNMPVPSGQWRYYDGMLHLLALLQTSGKFQIIEPKQ